MNQKPGWWMALAVVALLVAACGPQMATPTPKAVATAPAPTTAVGTAPTAALQATAAQPTAVPLDVSKLPVDPNDYHALGPADAKVTLVEYSDFQ